MYSWYLQGYIIFHSSNANFGGALRLVKSFLRFQYCVSTVSIRNGTVEYLCGYFCLVNNTALKGGGIYTFDSNISFSMSCSAVSSEKRASCNDTVNAGFKAKYFMSTLGLSSSPVVTFYKNKARYSGGSIVSINSHLYLMGTVLFVDNTADYGGAIDLDETSQLILKPLLNVVFARNIAHEKGGAILYRHFVQKSKSNKECFFSIGNSELKCFSDIH